ncbi:MAG: hypothetical protein JXQ84_05340 [Rhodospirillaceae bacterium]|nr:hypothetical protein [Rhodospirillaceae bacterium]
MSHVPPQPTVPDLPTALAVLRVRLAQIFINELYKAGRFRIPIHLALGHEAIAVAVAQTLDDHDILVLPHRNLHYALARGAGLAGVIDEFLLRDTGLAHGNLGAMNLADPARGLVYTSSILGNNLGVATGLALGGTICGDSGLTCVVTGDGAMEEGAFYEALGILCGKHIPLLLIVENNGWSLASTIAERRGPIDLDAFAKAMGAGYCYLNGADVFHCRTTLQAARNHALADRRPIIVEVGLTTLGHWRQPQTGYPNGKYINYHAGPAAHVSISPWPCLGDTTDDPIAALTTHFPEPLLHHEAMELFAHLQKEVPS